MNLLGDILTYIRRIIKFPSNQSISDDLLIDYVNRFWIMDVDARIQIFDLKKKYQFQTQPGVDQYNMPLYSIQTEGTEPNQASINYYPVYQGFLGPAYINGVQVTFETLQSNFWNSFPKVIQPLIQVATGDGGAEYTFNIPILSPVTPLPNESIQAILRGHVDVQGIISSGNGFQDPPRTNSFITNIPVTSVDSAFFITTLDVTGTNVIVQDSGQFLETDINQGLLMSPGQAPYGNVGLEPGYANGVNTVNYLTGMVNVTFPVDIPVGQPINAQCYYFQTGLPRSILYYNNVITLRMPPNTQFLVEMDGYMSPAAFMTSADAIPFAYMSEYIARGAARKILSDTGDTEQFQFYEPLFREQEILVWKRSQRQFTATRTPTIYSQGNNMFGGNNTSGWGGYS
jgi:hypothetical protein